MILNFELIPRNCWGKNLRTKLKPQNSWDKIRKDVYAKEEMYCHICRKKSDILDAHEVWEFDEENHIQKLVEIIGVCKSCHSVIHFGRTQEMARSGQISKEYEEKAIEHFLKVNECSMYNFQGEFMIAVNDFNRRSKITDWKLDLTFIEKQGYVVNKDVKE